ncbi:MAG: hypothetical protein AAFQ82_20360 [Myxococcota bacterium]
MSHIPQRKTRASIERSFVEGLSSERWQVLRDEVNRSPECRSYFDQLADLDHALCEHSVALGPASTDRVWAAIESDVIGESSVARERNLPWRALLKWAWVPGVAAFAALLFVSVPDAQFTARNAGQARSDFGLTAFVVDPVTQAVTRVQGSTARFDSGQVVQLAVTANRSARLGILGVDAQGDIQWYHRNNASDEVWVAKGDEVEEPVGPAWTIRPEDSPVSLWLVEIDPAGLNKEKLRDRILGEPVLILEASR